MSTPALHVDALSRRFGRSWVLQHLTFAVDAGERIMLTGPNGSGKTTLLRCLATALRPHAGAIRLDGEDLWANRRRLRQTVAMLSHDHGLYGDLSAEQNLRFWARLHGVACTPEALLSRVGLHGVGDRPLRQFSAGMTRRLALAVALLKPPRLLLLDEPFTALDTDGRALVVDIVEELTANGAMLVLSTHSPALGRRLCTRELCLDAGRVVDDRTLVEGP